VPARRGQMSLVGLGEGRLWSGLAGVVDEAGWDGWAMYRSSGVAEGGGIDRGRVAARVGGREGRRVVRRKQPPEGGGAPSWGLGDGGRLVRDWMQGDFPLRQG
jgi:hypothetical protein